MVQQDAILMMGLLERVVKMNKRKQICFKGGLVETLKSLNASQHFTVNTK